MAIKKTSTSSSVHLEEVKQETVSLLMAARGYSQSNFSTALTDCETRDEKHYVMRENVRITGFLSSIILWLGQQTGDLPDYYPERTDLDHLLPSEFVGIRHRAIQLSDRVSGAMFAAA